MDRGVAVGRVEQVPITGRQLGDERKTGIADEADRLLKGQSNDTARPTT